MGENSSYHSAIRSQANRLFRTLIGLLAFPATTQAVGTWGGGDPASFAGADVQSGSWWLILVGVVALLALSLFPRFAFSAVAVLIVWSVADSWIGSDAGAGTALLFAVWLYWNFWRGTEPPGNGGDK